MARLGRGSFTTQATSTTLALAIAILLAFSGTAVAQQCSVTSPERSLPLPVTNPDPSDRQAIMDLIHSHNWALDDRNVDRFVELFTDDLEYEACRGGGQVQIFSTTEKQGLRGWISGLFQVLQLQMLQTRHFVSNTLLHVEDEQDKDTVLGESTLLVTLQSVHSEVPEFDYTAVLKAIFERGDDGVWRFARLILITDTPEVQDRAR